MPPTKPLSSPPGLRLAIEAGRSWTDPEWWERSMVDVHGLINERMGYRPDVGAGDETRRKPAKPPGRKRKSSKPSWFDSK